jgi:hypothetical protein
MNVELLEIAASALGDLTEQVVFVGGATVELWITDEAAPEVRATDDVDVIVEVSTRGTYARFEEALRTRRFVNDQGSGVICRFHHKPSGLVLDAMPEEPSVLGFANRWQGDAAAQAIDVSLPSGRRIRVASPPYLLAMKLEAFRDRGRGDLLASRDLGDVIVLLDGRAEIVDEIAHASGPLRRYLADELSALSGRDDFDAGATGAMQPDDASQARLELVVLPRMRAIIADRPPD